ncbi:hypothetical protein HGRIS_012132 [Hohenbuehelia grisea]|uniref:Gamma-butyrobetaine dioxygenase n=1 Tax=Hohenbuehelia grisea TaxID=104357 RepID=A0ABR3IRE9_9AGAR
MSGFLSQTLRVSSRALTLKGSVFRSRQWSSYSQTDSALNVDALDASFPFVWLRDSCQSPTCVHPSTSQKLHRTSDIPIDIKPEADGVRLTSDGLAIKWSDGHESNFSKAFLARHASPNALSAFHKDIAPIAWDKSRISAAESLFVPYDSLRTPSGRLAAITQLASTGLLFVTGVPPEETTDSSCEMPKLAQYFGEIRRTFYGELWDVKNIRNSRNIAYTNLDLGLHMDLLYFQHPPRYQILHCLRNRVKGGTSLFVDALHAAETLRASDPAAFDILASTPVTFHYINDGHHLHHAHPTIELADPASAFPSTPTISHINYSPPFQAPLPLDTPAAFYPALRKFANILADPAAEFRYLLREGDAVLFDNRRVLHAREAFDDSAGKDGETNRWLKGCYLEADALMDYARVLRTTV